MENDKLSILKMIETGRVTADEGLRLLEALEAPKREDGGRGARESARGPRRVRILVTELGSGRRRADANLPMPLVDLALRLAARGANSSIRIGGRPVDPEDILRAAHEGIRGRILDIIDDAENVKVEVFLE